MLTQKQAVKLAMKMAKKENKETTRKAREFQKLIVAKIKKAAKAGNYEARIHAPEDYQAIAITALQHKGFGVTSSLEEGKRYMTVSW